MEKPTEPHSRQIKAGRYQAGQVGNVLGYFTKYGASWVSIELPSGRCVYRVDSTTKMPAGKRTCQEIHQQIEGLGPFKCGNCGIDFPGGQK